MTTPLGAVSVMVKSPSPWTESLAPEIVRLTLIPVTFALIKFELLIVIVDVVKSSLVSIPRCRRWEHSEERLGDGNGPNNRSGEPEC